ncbi:MAG: hypothetical protein ABIG52_02320 [Nanoarchaeota archaeon]
MATISKIFILSTLLRVEDLMTDGKIYAKKTAKDISSRKMR